MPEYTHTHTTSLTSGGRTISGTKTVTDGGNPRFSESVADETAIKYAFQVNVSKCKSLYMLSDQAVTITPYSASTGRTPIVLAAGEPLAWHEGMPFACPISDDCDTIEIANDSGAAAAVEVDAIVDPTPDA
jgi:hypothetical protein